MTFSRHSRAKEIFLDACHRPPAEWDAFLDDACGGDLEVKAEVRELLAFHVPPPVERIGRYRLVRLVGEGGMGEVWEAEQEEPLRRRVALKLIRAGLDSDQVVSRFEAERQALAVLNHPNVAQVFDAGATESGRPFIVMEYLKGETVTQYCDARRLSIPERVSILVSICEGIEHAHLKGIIHRDIKPSNILVQEVDGRPVPKTIDFGIAKATRGDLGGDQAQTAHGMLVGTPGYMSPEQAHTGGLDVDTRADVYSLGALAYELLSGHGPMESASPSEESLEAILRRIREEDPPKPSERINSPPGNREEAAVNRSATGPTLHRQLKGDLDWIVMKALEKDRERRYQSASALASDLRRHLLDQAIEARPPTLSYQAVKFARRHRVPVMAGMLILAALALGTVGLTIGLLRARAEAETALRVSELLMSTIEELDPNARGDRVASAEEILDRGVLRIDAELRDQPAVQARLYTAVGQAYLSLGLFARAQQALTRAVELSRRHLGPDDPETLQAVNQLGDALWQGGENLSESERLHRENLDAQRRVLGADHPSVSWTLESLAIIRWRRTDADSAAALLLKALEVSREARGPVHFDVARNLFWLGVVERGRGNADAAWANTVRSLEMIRETEGSEHPYTVWPLFQIGILHIDANEPDSARAYLQQSIELGERTLGGSHPTLAYPLSALGALAIEEGEAAAGRSLIARAASINETAFGPKSLRMPGVLNALGGALLAEGDLEGARAAHLRALAILEGHPEAPRRDLAVAFQRLSLVEAAAGNQELAIELAAKGDSAAASGSY